MLERQVARETEKQAASDLTAKLRDDRQPKIVSAQQLAGMRRSFSCRRVDLPDEISLLRRNVVPKSGDLVVAKVTSIGHHGRLELPEGRRAHLHVGDKIVVSYGHRYAPDQFEAEVPADMGECHLVAAGGIASRLISKHARIKDPTKLKPLGMIANADQRVLNLRDWKIDGQPIPKPLPPVLVVAGTSMNSGKTTAAVRLIKGLQRAGKRVGAAKVTGTGAGGDYWQMKDAGAVEVVDFTDAGYASTYLLGPQETEKVFLRLISHLGRVGLDAIVVEVADGILQSETAELLSAPGFAFYCDRVIFTASDAMGAVAGTQWLHARGLDVCAVSGLLSSSPLAVREAAAATGLPVLSRRALSDAATVEALLSGVL